MKSNKLVLQERISFSKTQHKWVELPDLLRIQLKGYEDFLQENVQERKNIGLESVFRSYFPIESANGDIVIEYVRYEVGEPKYTEEECFDKNLSYSVPIKAIFRLINRKTGEIKEKDIYFGDIPKMTKRGTFIFNGAERVVVNQIYKSPGVLFSYKNKEFSSKIVPEKGSWLEFIIDTKKDLMYVRIDSRRKILVTMFLRALEMSNSDIINNFFVVKKIDLSKISKEDMARLVNRYVAEDVFDDEGNLIVGAVEKLYPNTINQLFQKEKYIIKVIEPKSAAENRVLLNTLEKDDTKDNVNKAIKKIYSILHPGEAATIESIIKELKNMFFNPKLYDLGDVGRYKMVLKLYSNATEEEKNILLSQKTLSFNDIIKTLQHLIKVSTKKIPPDDVDHLGNRRVRNVNELLVNQLLLAFSKVEKNIIEKINSKEIEDMSPQNIISIKPVVSAINDFFGMSQLSQFMDQTNPLSELTHKRRLSALGPGGLSRDRAGFEVRDVHNTHYGRVCPIETPEGPNIGLIVSLATYANVNEYGFLETPYVVVNNRKVSGEVKYLSAMEEENYYIAQSNINLDKENRIIDDFVECRYKGNFVLVPAEKIQFIDVSPKQILSVSASTIPFIEHDDANRALMGSNMQRQAVPLLKADSPIVGTGMEKYVAKDSRAIVLSETSGKVKKVDSKTIIIEDKNKKEHVYTLIKNRRTNQDTIFNQKPLVYEGMTVNKGDVIADGFSSDKGELALGKNVLVAFMPWNGYNYEDSVLISERLLKDDEYTSIYSAVFECKAVETKLGSEEITREIPNVGDEAVKNLDENGIITVGAYVKPGDILVGKISPKGEPTETPEFRLLHAIFGEKAKDVRDTSLRLPHGEDGVVVDVKVFSAANGDELSPGVIKLVKVYIAKKRKIKPGDKIAGRHGNKGVISRVMAEEDMPFLPDGTPIDIVLNPLGVPSRMNLGQLFECILGLAGRFRGVKYECGVFEGATIEEITKELEKANKELYDRIKEERKQYGETEEEIKEYFNRVKIPLNGKYDLRDGRTGEKFENKVFVGVMYMLKLHHMVDDKMHARSVGPYSLVTQQPLRGKANFGGQRLGEMEVWALEAYGAANLLQEMLTIKSDDTDGRVRIYEGIIKGKYVSSPGIPESFNVLLQELRGLALDVQVFDKTGKRIPLTDKEKESSNIKTHLI